MLMFRRVVPECGAKLLRSRLSEFLEKKFVIQTVYLELPACNCQDLKLKDSKTFKQTMLITLLAIAEIDRPERRLREALELIETNCPHNYKFIKYMKV